MDKARIFVFITVVTVIMCVLGSLHLSKHLNIDRRILNSESRDVTDIGKYFSSDEDPLRTGWIVSNLSSQILGNSRPAPLSNTPDRQMVAIVVPYRNRSLHLDILNKELQSLLVRQNVSYRIFVVEQYGAGRFNRAKLFNVGYNESFKYGDFDCFIFHDVDLIPENPSIEYQCQDHPKHMSVAVDTLGYRLPYSTLAGGVLAMKKTVFEDVNGFSNLYFGWGGEDDDMSLRIRTKGYRITRPPPSVGRYQMVSHTKAAPSPKRFLLLESAKQRFATDGLNSLNYTVVFSKSTRHLTHISVKF